MPREDDRAVENARWQLRWRSRPICAALSLWPWIPCVLAGIYGATLLITLRSVVQGVYSSSDVAALPVIGDLIGRAPHGAVVTLGNIPWYSAVWFEELTRSLPAHRALWELTAWVLGLVGIGVTARATGRIAGRWAGATVAVICACAGTGLLSEQLAWSVHAVSYFHVCILGALLVPLARSDRWIAGRSRAHLALIAVVGAVTGLAIACDKLVIVAGLGPFVVAGALLVWLSPRDRLRRAASIGGLTVIAIGVAALVAHIAAAQNLRSAKFPIAFAEANQLVNHVGDLVGSLTVLDNGDFSNAIPSFTSVLAVLTATVVVVGLSGAVRVGHSTVRESLTPARRQLATETPIARARTVFLAFWIISSLATSLAFVLSSLPIGFSSSRYVVTVGYGAVVILVSSVSRNPRIRGRLLVTIGASVLIFSGLVGLLQGRSDNPTIRGQANAVVAFSRATHAVVAYAGYWDSLALSWASYEAVPVYPLAPCPVGFCPFHFNKISSWYAPRRGVRSVLILDPARDTVNGISVPAANLGPPIASESVEGLQLFAYSYDIAARLGKAHGD